MRQREVEIHHADLGLAYTHADWPPAFSIRLIDSMALRELDGAVRRARDRPGPEWHAGRGRSHRDRHRRRPGLVADRPRRRRGAHIDRRGTAENRGVVTSRYTGEVTPGGAPDVRELHPPDHHQGGRGQGDVQQRLPAPLPRHRRAGADRCRRGARPAAPLIGDAGLTTVVTTHQHWDHHRALADVVAATGARSSRLSPTPTRSPSRPGSRSPAARPGRHGRGRRAAASR